MNSSVILSLDAVRAADLALVGRKAANLGELTAYGLPVPPAFVVTTAAFRQFFASLGLQDEVERFDKTDASEWRDACTRVRQLIVSKTVAGDIEDEIISAHARLAGTDERMRSVVRSSATAEDLGRASFAGQHKTYYDVEPERLLEMIRRCWASLWSVEAVTYRATHGISHRSVAMAVIVQRMIRSEVSGIAFTADPVTRDTGEIIIESSWGMGAALADGRVTPDRYLVRRPTLQIRERRVAEKRVMVPADRMSERLVEVPQGRRYLETLAPRQIEAVATLALRCEERFGSPQDVEWALAGGELHLLQSRPITTPRRQEIARPAGKWVLFKAFAENFTDPMTPLQIDLMDRTFSPLIRAIGGRFYTSMVLIRLLLPLRLSDEALANLLYLTSEGVPDHRQFQPFKLPLTIIAAVVLWLVTGVSLARSRGMPDDFMNEYRTLCRDVESDPRLGPIGALRRLLTVGRFGDPIGQMVLPVNFGAAVRGSFWVGMVKAMLRRWAPNLRADAVAILCTCSGGVLSVEMGFDLVVLADLARKEPDIATLIVTSPPDTVLLRLRENPAAHAFLTQLDVFLAKHGHRTAKELEVQTPRWEDDPAPVIAMVRNHLESAAGFDLTSARVEKTREEMEDRLRRSLGWRWPVVRFAAQRAREFLKLRENSRFYHIMGFGVVRKKILAVEEELLRDGKLKCRGDIFFLLWPEVTALRSGSLQWADVEERIHDRRMEHVRLAKLSPPRTFGIDTTSAAERVALTDDVLRGQCASPGQCEGVTRVIFDPAADASLRPGEILVAPYADPAWAPLFLTAGAVVVEVGSYLSHAGTVAREYGMPFVVDVAGCTRRLRSGMRVFVDGDRGTVRILEGEQA